MGYSHIREVLYEKTIRGVENKGGRILAGYRYFV